MYGGAQADGAGRDQSFLERVIGAARIDRPTYEEVERDQNATTQAAIVVLLSVAVPAIATLFISVPAALALALTTLLGWIVGAAFVYLVGTRIIPSDRVEADFGQVLRTLGFAQAPAILLVLSPIPILGLLVVVVVFVWTIVTRIVAIQSALEASVGRAIAIAIIAAILAAIVQAIIYSLFGINPAEM